MRSILLLLHLSGVIVWIGGMFGVIYFLHYPRLSAGVETFGAA